MSAKERRIFEDATLPMDLDYASVIGRIRVLEDRFLNENDYRRLADHASSFHERNTILEKAGYTGEGSLESRVLEARDRNDRELKDLLSQTHLASFLLLNLDYHNVKAIIRFIHLEEFGKEELEIYTEKKEEEGLAENSDNALPKTLRETLRFSAPSPIPNLFHAVLSEMSGKSLSVNEHGLREDFYENIQKIVAKASSGAALAESDWLADQCYFEEMVKMSKEKDLHKLQSFTSDYVLLLAEFANWESYLRMRRANNSYETFQRVYVPNAYTSAEDFRANYADSEKMKDLFMVSPIAETFEQFPKYENSEEVADFGLRRDRLYRKIMRSGKFENQHPIAIVAFWIGKRIEQKNIRIILQAISRNMPTEKIMSLIRPGYKEAI